MAVVKTRPCEIEVMLWFGTEEEEVTNNNDVLCCEKMKTYVDYEYERKSLINTIE